MDKKKLLILGGAYPHCKLVEAARDMGVETYVTDFLPPERSPGKQIADHYWNLNIYDYDAIVEKCHEEGITGVLSAYLDSCQKPYQEICERLGLPCFGTREQFEILTDKRLFLKLCQKCDVDIIPQYSERDMHSHNPIVEYPVVIKPNSSRASKGMTLCASYEEVPAALELAKNESRDGEAIIERYIDMSQCQDIQLEYLVIDGEPYLVNAGDKHNGTREDNFYRMGILGITPSVHTDQILADAHEKLCYLIKELGIKNAPVFFQGFMDGPVLRVYDPGLRFAGCEHNRILKAATGLDLSKGLVTFALTGKMPKDLCKVQEGMRMNGKIGLLIFYPIRAGVIYSIHGQEHLAAQKHVLHVEYVRKEGDTVNETFDFQQMICEISALCPDWQGVRDTIAQIENSLQVLDQNGEDMKLHSLFKRFLANGGLGEI